MTARRKATELSCRCWNRWGGEGGKTNTLSTVDKDNYIMEYERNTSACAEKTSNRIINLFGKKVHVLGIRRLTPTECSRLQTIPTWYKWECSDSQAYRMLGNGWTVEVIKHIFNFLPFARERANESQRR